MNVLFLCRLGQSCNHVAALVHKVDFCWEYGYVNPACTSQPCVWNDGGKLTLIQPQRIMEMDLKKPSAQKKEKKNILNSKASFQPILNTEKRGMSFEEFMLSINEKVPNAVANFEHSDPPVKNTYYDKQTRHANVPKSLTDLAHSTLSTQEFLSRVPLYDVNDIRKIENATRGQASNPEWFRQRKGRITASNFRDVHTRVNSVISADVSSKVDCNKLLARVMGYIKVNPNLPSLKHGRQIEPIAIHEYRKTSSANGHKHVKINQCGLFVDSQRGYLGASPDGLVECCCGEGILEVKCPISCAHTFPSSDNVAFLVEKDGKDVLKRSHKYFDQVQGQLAITKRKWCDFFVFTRHGHFLERIYPDTIYWSSLALNLEYFYLNYMAPEIVSKELEMSLEVENTVRELMDEMISSVESDTSLNMSIPNVLQRSETGVKQALGDQKSEKKSGIKRKLDTRIKLGKQSKRKSKPVYICEICQFICNDSGSAISITCTKCHFWFHKSCANLEMNTKSQCWTCTKCNGDVPTLSDYSIN